MRWFGLTSVVTMATMIALSSAFVASPIKMNDGSGTTCLKMTSRRESFGAMAGLMLATASQPSKANAFSQQLEDPSYVEQAQMPTGGKIDLNNAFVVRLSFFVSARVA